VITALEAHVTTLQDMLAKAEAVAARERERADGASGKADQARADAERERTERLTERERADKLAGEVTALARKIADLMAQANARRPASLPPPAESVRRGWSWPWRRAG
jgi:hypothetical protein